MRAAAVGPAPGTHLLRELLVASRPLSWINTALPFGAAAYDVQRGLSIPVVLGVLYYLVPFNLLMYGVNDIFDYASDLANPRKQSLEGGLIPPDRRRVTWIAIALTNVPLLAAIALTAPAAGTAAVLLSAGAAVIYSAPPLRTKEVPVADSLTSASHFVLPAVAGFLVAGLLPQDLPWLVLAAFTCWAVASHALGAIQDIVYDRTAGIASIATAFGARRTALLSGAGYAAAALVPATFGGAAGWIAAAALATYLLLPLGIVLDPSERQARRAWRSFLGLNFLVGFVLTQLLLRAWGIVTTPPRELLTGVVVVAAALPLANLIATVLLVRAPTPSPGRRGAVPALTVVIPCRDEAPRLPAVLASLAGQDHPSMRVIVVDDGSSDGSASVASRELRRLRPSHDDRVVAAPPKPSTWAGKSWACHQAIGLTSDPHVLFLDADTVLAPDACSRLAATLATRRVALVSGVSRYAMPSWPERALLPGFPMTIFGLLPLWLLQLTGGRPASMAFAYGPVTIVDRATYLRAGGHAARPGSEREDVDLARTIAAAGGRIGLVRLAGLASTRHYPDGRGALEAWRRVFVAYTGGSYALGLASLGVAGLAWASPLVLPVVGLAVADSAMVMAGLAAAGMLLLFRVLLAWREAEPISSVVLHPVTVVATLGAQLLSMIDALRGRPARWRGRAHQGVSP